MESAERDIRKSRQQVRSVRREVRARRIASTIILLSSLAPKLGAQATWTYDHLANCPTPPAGAVRSSGCTMQKTLSIKPGDHFTIAIAHTVASAFTIDIAGYVTSIDTKVGERQLDRTGAAAEAKDTIFVSATHDARYGGYVISITPKSGAGTLPVAPATLVITVPQTKAPYAFSGGLSLTNIRNPGFVVRQEVDTAVTAPGATKIDTVNRVRNDSTRRDAATVGFATFLTVNLPNVHNVNLSWLNLSLGIGLETSGQTQYYFGLGAELQDGIFLNAGYVLGRVNTLPAGLEVGDIVADANALANLSRRNAGGVFLGLSFSFLGGGKETFGKPFAGSQQ